MNRSKGKTAAGKAAAAAAAGNTQGTIGRKSPKKTSPNRRERRTSSTGKTIRQAKQEGWIWDKDGIPRKTRPGDRATQTTPRQHVTLPPPPLPHRRYPREYENTVRFFNEQRDDLNSYLESVAARRFLPEEDSDDDSS